MKSRLPLAAALIFCNLAGEYRQNAEKVYFDQSQKYKILQKISTYFSSNFGSRSGRGSGFLACMVKCSLRMFALESNSIVTSLNRT